VHLREPAGKIHHGAGRGHHGACGAYSGPSPPNPCQPTLCLSLAHSGPSLLLRLAMQCVRHTNNSHTDAPLSRTRRRRRTDGTTQARKLLLRGYTVKALVRSRDEEVKASLPRAVQVVYGDVGEPADCKEALKVRTRDDGLAASPLSGANCSVACVQSVACQTHTTEPSRHRKAQGISRWINDASCANHCVYTSHPTFSSRGVAGVGGQWDSWVPLQGNDEACGSLRNVVPAHGRLGAGVQQGGVCGGRALHRHVGPLPRRAAGRAELDTGAAGACVRWSCMPRLRLSRVRCACSPGCVRHWVPRAAPLLRHLTSPRVRFMRRRTTGPEPRERGGRSTHAQDEAHAVPLQERGEPGGVGVRDELHGARRHGGQHGGAGPGQGPREPRGESFLTL
jgi:hypothetical protein